MNIFHAYHVQVQVSLYSFPKELCMNTKNFMNIVETITKNMINHVFCLKMSFENTL